MKIVTLRVFLVILCMAGLFSLAGCQDETDTGSYDVGNADGYTLSDFDGWWKRPDGYVSEGFSMVDIFKVDAADRTWTIYNNYGMSFDTFGCSSRGDGIVLEMPELFGNIVFTYDGTSLIDEEGKIHFVRGTPVEPFDLSSFEGKWYKDGDISEEYYLLEADTFKKFSPYMPDEPLETGTWIINDITRITSSGNEPITQLEMSSPDDVFAGGDFQLTDNNTKLYDYFHEVTYIKESAIGISGDGFDGDDDDYDNDYYNTIAGIIMDKRYYCETKRSLSITFHRDGEFTISDDEGTLVGTYAIIEDEIYLASLDGEEAAVYLTIDRSGDVVLFGENGEMYVCIDSIYTNEVYNIIVFDMDEDGLEYIITFHATADSEIMREYAWQTDDPNSIWAYSDDDLGITFTFYNDGHAVNITAENEADWDDTALFGYYERMIR